MSPLEITGWALAGGALWIAGHMTAIWLCGALTRNGKTCRFGHAWERVNEVDLGGPSRAWECARCQSGIDGGSRLVDRILWRIGLGRLAPGKGLMLYAGKPGTLHVASWLVRGAPVRVSDGSRLPWGYGWARRDFAHLVTIALPVPLNWPYAAAWWLWWRSAVRPPWVRRLAAQQAELVVREDELRELVSRVECELQAGRRVERALERGRT